MDRKLLTLCIVHKDKKVLLGMKKRGFGEGRWNGFGGKVEAQESIENAALRELEEEVGIVANDFYKSGVLNFIFEKEIEDLEVHVFVVLSFTGEPRETEEMRPQWFNHKEIPYSQMWPDDEFWLPHVLSGKRVRGTFRFKDVNTMLDHELSVVS